MGIERDKGAVPMENAALIGLSRQIALRHELDVIANNVANVTTNGFKARDARFREHLMPLAQTEAFPKVDQRPSFVLTAGTPVDMSIGSIERTGNPLDAAIKGDAFFAVQTAGGERYTRNGSFIVNQQGQLVTSDGHVVLGENGPITLSSQDTNPNIAPDGTVSVDQGNRGRLRLVTFADPRNLQSESQNLFSSTTPANPAGPTARVEPGAVERSNVKPVFEMSRLIEVNRSYASVTSMLQRMDEMRRSAIQRLADVS